MSLTGAPLKLRGIDWRHIHLRPSPAPQADEFVGLVERSEVRGLVQRAAAAAPAATLSLMVEGLQHHLESRERREFR